MKRFLQLFLLIIFSFGILPLPVFALDYHWEGAGATKNWNDPGNWKTRPGNTGAFVNNAVVPPGATDNVYFDATSFDPVNANVIISGLPVATCARMDWTGATSVVNPIIEGNGRLEIYGDLILVANIDISFTGIIEFKGYVEQDIRAFPALNGTLIINNPIKCTLSAPLTVRNITIANTSTLDVTPLDPTKPGASTNNKTTVRGNWQGNGTFIARNGTVSFEGTHPTIPQTIYSNPSDGVHEFYNVEINNSGAGINLLSEVKIGKNIGNTNLPLNNGSVTFTDGIVTTTDANILTFNDNTFVRTLDELGNPVTGDANNESHVVGPVRKIGNGNYKGNDDEFYFPIGDGSYYRPAGLKFQNSNPNAQFVAKYTRRTPANVNYPPSNANSPLTISRFEYWEIERTGGNASTRVILTWEIPVSGPENYLGEPANVEDLLVAYWNSTNPLSGEWRRLNSNNQTVTNPNPATYSGHTRMQVAMANNDRRVYTIGSEIIPLPIELLYFKANLANGVVQLDWATASEKDNDYFTIEKSTDSKHFEAFLEVDAAGNSQQVQTYAATDANPVSPVSYYRLKQTDIDGKFTYSKIVAIHSGSKASLSITPLTEKQVRLTYYLPQSKEAMLSLYDTKGVLVWNKFVSGNAGLQVETIKLSYPSGMYLLTMQQTGETIVKKIFIR